MYKAEKQLLSLSHDEWNRLGEKFGVSGQVARREAARIRLRVSCWAFLYSSFPQKNRKYFYFSS